MSNERALQPIERGSWQTMVEQASMLVKSGFLPSHIKTAEQAVAVMLTGQELGIPAMTALRTVAVIQGKVALQAELMAALIERDYGSNALRVEETDDTSCTVSYWKPGWSDRKCYTFTIQQAKTAGITNNPTWGKYPAAMLRARCISAVAKMAFQATLGGIYTPEEMGAPVDVTEDGEVVYAPETHEMTFRDGTSESPVPTPIAERAGSGPLHPLGRKRAAEVYRQMAELRNYSESDMDAWMQHHGFAGIKDMPKLTEAQADQLKRDAVQRKRPWETPEMGDLATAAYDGLVPPIGAEYLIGDDFDAEDEGGAA